MGKKFRMFGAFEKVEAQEDGTLIVSGIASSETVDGAGETVKADAMKAAIPDYMKFGAVREMHQPIAAGTAVSIAVNESGQTEFEAHVVDAGSVQKVNAGVLKGFSIGGKVTGRDQTNKSIITGLKLTEISLVDVPCNPDSVFSLVKLDDGGEADDAEKGDVAGHEFHGNQHTGGGGGGDHAKDADKATDHAEGASQDAERASGDVQTQSDHNWAASQHEKAAEAHDKAAEANGKVGSDHPMSEHYQDMKEHHQTTADAHRNAAAWHKDQATSKLDKGAIAKFENPEESEMDTPETTITDPTPEPEPIKKGMWSVQDFAGILMNIGWMAQDAKWESENEGDASPVPSKLAAWLAAGAEIFKEMAAEEVAELLATLKPKDGVEAIAMAAGAGDLAKAGAKFSAASKASLDAVHQEATDLHKAMGDCLGKMAGLWNDGDDTDKAAITEAITKASGLTEELAKVQAEKDALQKSLDAISEDLKKSKDALDVAETKLKEKGVSKVVPVEKGAESKSLNGVADAPDPSDPLAVMKAAQAQPLNLIYNRPAIQG